MDPYYLIIAILASHWVADFVLQSDAVAVGKSSSNLTLSWHVLIYTVFMYCTAGTVMILTGSIGPALLWVTLNAALHWLTDWCTSRATSYLWKKGDRHNFFVMVGFDQLIHAACLILTLRWIVPSI